MQERNKVREQGKQKPLPLAAEEIEEAEEQEDVRGAAKEEPQEDDGFSIDMTEFVKKDEEEPESIEEDLRPSREGQDSPEVKKTNSGDGARRSRENTHQRGQEGRDRGRGGGRRDSGPERVRRENTQQRVRREPSSKPVKSSKPAKPAKKRTPQQEARLKKRRRIFLSRFLMAFILLAGVGFCVYYYVYNRTYHGYRLTVSKQAEDVVSAGYEDFDGKVLKYTQDEVSLLDGDLNTYWATPYKMAAPEAYIRGTRAVIADRDGTSLVILNENGVTGTVNTPYSIVKACISKGGRVAVILDGGNSTWINFYDPNGTLIAENQTTLEEPGYPLDLALSDNGVIMMVTYQYVNGSSTTSYVAFYHFGSVGQNAPDRIVSGFRYEGHVVPQIAYLGSGRSVAFRDDGFILYSGSQYPAEAKMITCEQEIVSTFYDDENIGLVFKNGDKTKQYTMEVYDVYGELKFATDFNIAYTTIKMSHGYILLYNSAQLCVVTDEGQQRYLGALDGAISDVSRIGLNKYVLVLDNSINVMRLS